VTVLAGFPAVGTALAACSGSLAQHIAQAQLIELCGAFSSSDVHQIRSLVENEIPIGIVTYTGNMGIHSRASGTNSAIARLTAAASSMFAM